MRNEMFAFIGIIVTSNACSADPSGWAELDGLGVVGVIPEGEAYVCGIGDSVDRSRWLAGDLEAMGDTDGVWNLSIESDGTFSLEDIDRGDSWTGSLEPFEDGGLYTGSPENCRSGAVLYGGQLAGTFCDGLGIFRQVEPVDTLIGGPDFISVRLIQDITYTFDMSRLP